jgi:nondiscriminating glutamyl-tRNA synthetase
MENINHSKPRIRIAPSPTGLVHIGTLRTMLYDYLFAKHYNGKFIIRVEDTDRERLVPGAIEDLLEAMKWAGLEADEGPYLTQDRKIKQKGDYGPYIQSERLDIYKQHIDVLLDKNKAYPCFCSKERLTELREDQVKNKKPPKYDGFCRDLSKEEQQAMIGQGKPYVVRFRMPESKDVVVKDLIRGDIVVNSKDLDDYVLIKSDKFPTYHFASVVDDHLMKITHITRGDEWIASTPKHVLLYEAMDWNTPYFAHFPPILAKNKKKLSKRDGDTAVSDYIKKGYLKDALLNFIALLGWNAGTDQEIYTLRELEKQFTLDNIHKAGAIFDVEKLDWINGQYIRKLSIDEFYDKTIEYLEADGLVKVSDEHVIIVDTGEKVKPAQIKKILGLEQSRIKRLTEISDATEFFFKKEIEYDEKSLIWKKSDAKETIENLKKAEELFTGIKEEQFTKENIEKELIEFMEKNSIGTGNMLWPIRVALSGRDRSPGPFELAGTLGKEKTIERIGKAVSKLL